MTHFEFIDKLNSLAINESKLREIGFGDYSETLIKGFYPERTNKTSSSDNLIIQLIEEFDCRCIGLVSPISLNEEVGETDTFILIGWVWEDLLAIDKASGEIVMLAYWDYDLITFHCAVNSENFLRAFLIHGIAKFDIDFENEEQEWAYNTLKAEEAADIAGGNIYAILDGLISNKQF